MKIAILGDSFSSDTDPDSWISLLNTDHDIYNFSQRGISEYRIYKILKENISTINQYDKLILWHTNPYRIYISDDVDLPTRELSSHSTADMVAEDVLNIPGWDKIAKIYYKYFFDKEQSKLFFDLLCIKLREIVSIPVIECTGFDTDDSLIKSFYKQRTQYRGNINHMNIEGNKLVYKWINEQL